MMYRILGQLAIGADREMDLPGGHALMVLAVLLIQPNRRVSKADLIRLVWGTEDVDHVQLHKCISGIRGLLRSVGRRDDLLTHSNFGYELRCGPDDHDMLAFQRLLLDADSATGDVEREVELLRAALRLWRGPQPLGGVPGESVKTLGADLRHRRKRAVVRLAELEFGRGRHAQVLDELRTLVSCHPSDQRLCAQFMIALYRNGHGAEALEVYEQHAAALEAEAAAPPHPQLRSLKFAIATDDEAAVEQIETMGAQRPAAAAQSVVVPRQLPPDLATFVGRDNQVAEARWLLTRTERAAPPVVVTVGPGGIGKTALAVHVAHLVRAEYPDGQLYLELGGTTPQPAAPAEVLAQVHRALGVTKVPDMPEERTALFRSLLGNRRMLLVLDDARDEAQIRPLIPGNPQCGVLVTARRRLPGLSGAHHLPTLLPLDDALATELFERTVRDAGVDPASDPGAVRRIVRLCAGLPLAIAITAALRGRDDAGSARDLAERLAEQPLDTLVYGDASVARSIGAGFDQLDPAARKLLLGLGVLHLPEFGVWTAAAVLDDPSAEPYEVLLRLARCHLLQPVGEGRYRFHDLTRECAALRARQRGGADADPVPVPARVYGALLTLARRAHRNIYGGDYEVVHGTTPTWPAPPGVVEDVDRAPLAWYESERLNLRAAVRHAAEAGLAEIAWDLAVSTHEFYNLRGYLDDWQVTHADALAACRSAGNMRGEAATLAILGQPALLASRRSDASGPADLARAVDLFRRCGDRHGEAIARRTLANHLRREGRFAEALAEFAAARDLYEGSGDEVGRWQALRYTGQTYLDLDDHAQALRLLREAQEVAEGVGTARLLAQTAYWLGRTYLAAGEPGRAREQFERVLVRVGDADRTGRAYATYGLGIVAQREGWAEDALGYFTVALESTQGDDAVLDGQIHQSVSELHLAAGRRDAAAAALARAVACFTSADAEHLRRVAQAARDDLAA